MGTMTKIAKGNSLIANQQGQSRNSSIELLRIMMMFYIIYGHAMSQSAIPKDMPIGNTILTYCFSFARAATLCFMVLSGWYMNINQGIKDTYRKMIKLWIKFACELFLISCFCILKYDYDWNYLRLSFFPLSWRPLWYVACYIMFLAFVPLINAAYKQLEDDVSGRRMIAVATGFMIFGLGTISPFLFGIDADRFPTFYSELLVYIVAYIVVKFLKQDLERVPNLIWYLVLILGFFFFVIVRSLYFLSAERGLIDRFLGMNYLRKFVGVFYSHIETLPLLLFSVSVIMLTKKIQFHSRIINKISVCTISVYVIHQMPLLYPHLWDEIYRVNLFASKPIWIFFLYMIFVFVTLYAVSFIIDTILNNAIDFGEKMIYMSRHRKDSNSGKC